MVLVGLGDTSPPWRGDCRVCLTEVCSGKCAVEAGSDWGGGWSPCSTFYSAQASRAAWVQTCQKQRRSRKTFQRRERKQSDAYILKKPHMDGASPLCDTGVCVGRSGCRSRWRVFPIVTWFTSEPGPEPSALPPLVSFWVFSLLLCTHFLLLLWFLYLFFLSVFNKV